MAIEGAVGLDMAGRGATLVLRTSWFNRSSCICAKEITAIRVYGCRAFTSPRISGLEDDHRLIDLRLGGGRRMKATSKAIVEIALKMEAAEVAIGQQECGFNTMIEPQKELYRF
ncbi:hypothetical protein BHE74_00027672 [Ensete ventricosum]|nr:hypothetical protein BHE74_00027672 [Ensete ventricosum]